MYSTIERSFEDELRSAIYNVENQTAEYCIYELFNSQEDYWKYLDYKLYMMLKESSNADLLLIT